MTNERQFIFPDLPAPRPSGEYTATDMLGFAHTVLEKWIYEHPYQEKSVSYAIEKLASIVNASRRSSSQYDDAVEALLALCAARTEITAHGGQ